MDGSSLDGIKLHEMMITRADMIMHLERFNLFLKILIIINGMKLLF